jgi:hypothetical protein
MKGAVGRRLAERVAGLRRGQRPGVREQLDQGHPDGMGERPHGARIRQLSGRRGCSGLFGSHVSKFWLETILPKKAAASRGPVSGKR